MTVSADLVEFIKRWEGCSLTEYIDLNGVPTCGWGHANPKNTPWTQEHADQILLDDLNNAAIAIRKYMKREPNQRQWDAMTSIAYNCGSSVIGNSGLMSRFNDGDDHRTCLRFLLWDRAGGREVPGLLKRRMAEVQIYQNADYSGAP